jgi:hypothetical protein
MLLNVVFIILCLYKTQKRSALADLLFRSNSHPHHASKRLASSVPAAEHAAFPSSDLQPW